MYHDVEVVVGEADVLLCLSFGEVAVVALKEDDGVIVGPAHNVQEGVLGDCRKQYPGMK